MRIRVQTRLICAVLACFLAAALFTACNTGNVGVGSGTKGGSPASPDTPAGSTTPAPTDTPATPSDDPATPSGDPTPSTPTPTPVTPTPPTPTPVEPATKVSSFTLLSAGDNLLHRGILKDGQEHKRSGKDEEYYFDFIYDNLKKQVSAADYAIINQESIVLLKRYLSGKTHIQKTETVSFCSPPEVLDSLLRTGFDGIDMANNHALDMGSGGLQWALDGLNKRNSDADTSNDIMFFGAFYDEADRANIRTIEVNGIKVALLAYTYGTNKTSEDARAFDPSFRFLVPYIDDEKMIEELRAANEIADFTVVYMHWGDEYTFEPNAEQRRLAALLAENGAGAIVGHHSHTIQPIEYIPDGKGGQVLCAYSLGTLISNMDTDMNMLAGLFTFEITKWSDGRVTAENPVFTPTVFYFNMEYKQSKVVYLKDLTASMARSHGIGNYPKNKTPKNTMTVERMYDYLHGAIDDKYLPGEYRQS